MAMAFTCAMAQFTTGEAVALELSIARIPSRLAAFALDVAAQLALLGILGSTALSAARSLDFDAVTAVATAVVVTVLVGYPVVLETLLRGRTVGKLALGLRVVRSDGGPIDFRHALTRGLCGATVDFWGLGLFGMIALAASLCSANGRRIGDVLAGTVVVYANAPMPAPALALAPPWLSGWAAHLDLTALPDDLAVTTRSYLTRFAEFTPATQHELGRALVIEVCAALGTAIPGQYPPLQILGAVIAERQRRELAVVTAAAGWQHPVRRIA
jgi:uncharacterized RDD family membrane protein YckC